MDLGLDRAGMECAWQVEKSAVCLSILRRHWPGVPKHTDIMEVKPEDLGAVDLISGGSPCQDLSVAGSGEGLDGERSGLFFEFCRVADSQPAAWILWENVDGALSTNGGADFGIILRELSGFWPAVPADGWKSAGVCVGPKRWLVWRVLDSQYFGVPQRRRRVFIVGGPGGGACFPEVLLEPESLSRNPPARRSPGESVAALLAGGSGGRGHRIGADEVAGGHAIVSALTSSKGGPDDNAAQAGHLVAGPLTTRPYADHAAQEGRLVARALTSHHGRLDFESETLLPTVAGTLRSAGHDASEDGTGRQNLIPVPYRLAQITHPENRANPQPGDPAPSLNGDARLAIAYQCHGSNDLCGTLGTNGNNRGFHVGHENRGVRRLTPRECERLQGWPDDWTRWAADGRELADSPRYEMIGNGVTAPVAEWIGRRIMAALSPSSKP